MTYRQPTRSLVFLAILLVSCGPARDAVRKISVEAPADLESAWEALEVRFPLPSGYQPVLARPGEAATPSQAPEMRVTLSHQPAGSSAGDSRKVIGRIVLAPVGHLGSYRQSVALAEIRGGTVQVMPISDIELPAVALAVDGLLPDDPAYPLADEILIGIDGPDPALRRWFDAISPSLSSPQPQPILWIGAVGDIMPARGVDAAILRTGKGAGIEAVFGDTLPILRSCDFLVGNLEAAATRGGSRTKKSYTFRFDPAALEGLRRAGFTYLSIANNHSFDFGAQGFIDTIDGLARAGIATSGVGRNIAQASTAFASTVKGVELRVLSFAGYPVESTGFDGSRLTRAGSSSPGVMWLDDKALEAVAAQMPESVLGVVLVHWGAEWRASPTESQRKMAERLIEAGADLVIGSHSHVLQGLQASKGGLAAFSLGNFLFPGMEQTRGGTDSAILRFGVYEGKIRYVQVFPLRLSGRTVRLAAPAAGSTGLTVIR